MGEPAGEDESIQRLKRARAFCELKAGNPEAGAEQVAEVVLANPLDGQALLLFADHLLDQNQTEHAIMRLEQAAAAEGFEAPARRRLGEVLAGRGDYARAVSELRKALEIEPADQTLRDYLDSISRLAGLGERR